MGGEGPAVFECRRGGDSRSPTVAPFCMDTGVAHARRCATTGAVWSMTCRSSMVFDVPVIMQRRELRQRMMHLALCSLG